MFLQAGSPAELRAYMAQYPDSRCIAGGTDIMPVQNRENDREAVFIDISGAAALHRIVSEDGVLSVGAAATFAEIERNALLRQYAPVLCLAASQVGSPQIRNLGTIGGNVAHGSPAADTLPVLAMLDAEVRLYSALTELSVTKNFKLLSIDEEHQKAAIEQHSYFSTATLSADLYTCTSEDTTTLAMPTLLACDSSLSNEAAYQFVKGIYENLDVISTSHAMAAKINLDHAANINLEIHPGALQYYREMGIVD